MVLRIVVPVSLQGIGALADGTSARRGKNCHTFLFECLASQVYSAVLGRRMLTLSRSSHIRLFSLSYTPSLFLLSAEFCFIFFLPYPC